jgi:hypothetical protein
VTDIDGREVEAEEGGREAEGRAGIAGAEDPSAVGDCDLLSVSALIEESFCVDSVVLSVIGGLSLVGVSPTAIVLISRGDAGDFVVSFETSSPSVLLCSFIASCSSRASASKNSSSPSST